MARKTGYEALKLKFYICGPISGWVDQGYRQQIRRLLSRRGHSYFDPYLEETKMMGVRGRGLAGLDDLRRGTARDRKTSREIIKRDFEAIRKCDLLVAYLPVPSVGSAMELLYSHLLKMPTVAIVPGQTIGWAHVADVVLRRIDEFEGLIKNERRMRQLVEKYR